MKSQDILILLKLVSLQEVEKLGQPQGKDVYSVRGLGASLGISKSEISASINRCYASGLAIKDRAFDRPKPNRRDLCNFITHGLKFVFPVKPGGLTRGLPTGFAAPMLDSFLISGGEHLCVWPYAHGKDLGQSVEPLFKSVPFAVQEDERLYKYLALIDAMRLGRQREFKLAADHLSEELLSR